MFLRLLLTILALSTCAAPLDAQRRGSSGHSSGAGTSVHGYTRHNGTYIHPYTRSTPRSSATPRSYATPRRRAYSAPKSYAPQPPSYGVRDSRGKIHRSREARDEFLRRTGYPHGRPGYVVDHVVPLCAGGADDPSNMQWQTVADAKAKDRQERAECARH